jgi:hypothetical protein
VHPAERVPPVLIGEPGVESGIEDRAKRGERRVRELFRRRDDETRVRA